MKKEKLKNFFENYNIDLNCKSVHIGDNFITYIVDLKCKTKVSAIKKYKDNLKLSFNALDVEFQIAINQTPYLGIHLIKKINKLITRRS